MNCVMVKNLENEFLDESLPPEQRDAVEEHLQLCQSCRQEVELLLGFQKSLRECRQTPPQALETLVIGAVHRRLQRRHFWREWRHDLWLWLGDWDKKLIFSKLAAVPVTFCFFVWLLGEFSYAPQTAWYPVYDLDENAVLSNDRQDVIRLSYRPMVEFAENSSLVAPDDSFVVLTRVNPNGLTTLEKVIDAPNHELLLHLFANRMEAVRYYPLLRSGNRGYSYVIVPYQKISVVG